MLIANRASFRASFAFVAFVVHVRASLAIVSIDVLALVDAHSSDVYPCRFFLDPEHERKEEFERKCQINELIC